MLQQGLRHFSDMPLILIAMFIFFVTYLGVLSLTLIGRKSNERMERFAGIPLQEDEQK